jgi:hypothetical protein
MLLGQSRRKLGAAVRAFNLPLVTCPGATPACRAVCYADKGNFRWPQSRRAYQRNLEASLGHDFAERMIGEIARSRRVLVRVHDGGDYYGATYVEKWIQIARQLPGVTFWAYTRSWRGPRSAELLPPLAAWAGLPNCHLWFSCDEFSGEPPRVPGVRRAWMWVGQSPPYPVDLVFPVRVRGRLVPSRLNGVLVCPTYAGHPDLTCEKCGFCFRK